MNGVKGRTFTSTINGNSIFLPAAGFRDGVYIGAEGSYGYYWSSSRVRQYPNEAQRILIRNCFEMFGFKFYSRYYDDYFWILKEQWRSIVTEKDKKKRIIDA